MARLKKMTPVTYVMGLGITPKAAVAMFKTSDVGVALDRKLMACVTLGADLGYQVLLAVIKNVTRQRPLTVAIYVAVKAKLTTVAPVILPYVAHGLPLPCATHLATALELLTKAGIVSALHVKRRKRFPVTAL